MAGEITTGSLAQSLPYFIAGSRLVREHDGVYNRTTDAQTLKTGSGLDWNEISLSQFTAQTITETTTLNNPQDIADTLFSVTPTMTGIHLKWTDRMKNRVDNGVAAKVGKGAQIAMNRRKDQDYIAMGATFTTTLAGTGTTMNSGYISAGVSRIRSNTTEPSMDTIFAVLHGYQVKDLRDELTAGIGTYTVPEGMTAEIFRQGFDGTVDGANVFTGNNITIDSTPDARGLLHAREAVVMVQGRGIKTYTRVVPDYGGGGEELFLYDEYAFGERSAGNWAYSILTDATAPTS